MIYNSSEHFLAHLRKLGGKMHFTKKNLIKPLLPHPQTRTVVNKNNLNAFQQSQQRGEGLGFNVYHLYFLYQLLLLSLQEF